MFQYPKNNHITLPSVEGGFGTMNILRDPPKAIWTRYKPKVGQTSEITSQIGCAGDRVSEIIKPFARGINPMVSVDYSNYGTNGGQMTDVGSRSTPASQNLRRIGSNGQQSYYPYNVNKGGAFRPPIIPPQELLPLSRQPRLPKNQQTNPGSAAITRNAKNIMSCSTDLKQVRQDLLKTFAPPRAIFNMNGPIGNPQQVKSFINDKTYQPVQTALSDSKQYTLGINTTPKYGIKSQENTLYGSISVNPYRNIQVGGIVDTCRGNQPMPIQDTLKGSVQTNTSGLKNDQLNTRMRQLSLNRPNASMMTNPGMRTQPNDTTNRTYKLLPPKRQLGGFDNGGCITNFERQTPQVKLKADSIYLQAGRQAIQRE